MDTSAPELIDVRVTRLEDRFLDVKDDLGDIRSDVKEIRHALTARPSWTVALALTIMSSLTVGSVTAAVLH